MRHPRELAHGAAANEPLPMVDLKAREVVALEWRRLHRIVEHKHKARVARIAIVEDSL